MKKRTLLYTCITCNTPVFRVGRTCNKGLKLCGGCAQRKVVASPRTSERRSEDRSLAVSGKEHGTSSQRALRAESSKSVFDTIQKYQNIITVAKRLANEAFQASPKGAQTTDVDITFSELWDKAKEELGLKNQKTL